MSIQTDISQAAKTAMKARDQLSLSVLRSLQAALTNELVAKGKKPTDNLNDGEALAVIKRAAKQRQDSIDQYQAGGRPDLADQEAKELAIIQDWLPAQLNSAEIKAVVAAKQTQLAIKDKSQMGQLIGAVMAELGNQADGAKVRQAVEEVLI